MSVELNVLIIKSFPYSALEQSSSFFVPKNLSRKVEFWTFFELCFTQLLGLLSLLWNFGVLFSSLSHSCYISLSSPDLTHFSSYMVVLWNESRERRLNVQRLFSLTCYCEVVVCMKKFVRVSQNLSLFGTTFNYSSKEKRNLLWTAPFSTVKTTEDAKQSSFTFLKFFDIGNCQFIYLDLIFFVQLRVMV